MKHRLASVSEACALLYEGGRTVSILNQLSWSPEVKERFFAAGARELPVVTYEAADTRSTLAAVEAVRALSLPGGEIGEWIRDTTDAIETGAKMVGAVGTAEFHEHSVALYGLPSAPIEDGASTALELAETVHRVHEGLTRGDLGAPPEACHLARALAEEMSAALSLFGEDAPKIEIVPGLRANATAGADRIRIRADACFTDMDLKQLVQHEVLVHVATALNGRRQSDMKVLGLSHPGTTRTQEGLAVYAEFIGGAIDPDRLRRLADRVLAIDMAARGADFLQVYAFFEEQTGDPGQAFENARRVFRGGVLTGGAPFTKDAVYLDGVLRVHNFLTAIVANNRIDVLRLLFCGRLDLAHIPAIAELAAAGKVVPPRFLPPWARDLRNLVAHLTYSAFANQVALDKVVSHYESSLQNTPRISWETSTTA